jgi:predicted NAD-dependent protein-ADP-ribosyltransferase YbiA (DUF1768 family)
MSIRFFQSDTPYFEFSNYSLHPFVLDDKTWCCSEVYYQAQKFQNVSGADEYFQLIASCDSPQKAKNMGGQVISPRAERWWINKKRPELGYVNDAVRRFSHLQIRSDWKEAMEEVMRKALWAKFTQHQSLRELLLSTKDAVIIEDSPFDGYWGRGRDGSGKNRLGFLLMELRAKLWMDTLGKNSNQ